MSKKSQPYLVMRGMKYWFKRDIPAAIRGSFEGKTAYLVNLETSDLKVAVKRRDELTRKTDEFFKKARAGELTPAEFDPVAAAGRYWREQVRMYRESEELWNVSFNGATQSIPDPYNGEIEVVADEPYSHIADEGERIANRYGAKAEARFRAILSGGTPLDQYVEAYLAEAKLALKTTEEKRNLLQRVCKWAEQEGVMISAVTRKIAGAYYTQYIAPLHPATAKKHLSSVKLYWDYLIIRGHAEAPNPWEGQKLPDRSRRVERDDEPDERPFTDEEVRRLLYSPFPRGQSLTFESQLHDAMRIAALSGMRLAEIITLHVEECVFDEAGNGTFTIRQGKTKAAARDVPIHSQLVNLVRGRMESKAPRDWLFHELQHIKTSADTFGKRFAQYREKLGVDERVEGKRRSLVNFHSFRRWFITKAEQADQMDNIISSVVGHEKGRKSVALGTYSAGASDIQKRRCVEAVVLPERAAHQVVSQSV